MITTEEIKNEITEESGMEFTVMNENENKLSLKIGENIHEFTITEAGVAWGVWIGDYYDDQGFLTESELLLELRNIS